MTIQSSNIDQHNGVDCDKILMSELCLSQRDIKTDSDPRRISLSIAYHKFGVENGNVTTLPDAKTLSIDDYYALSAQKAAAGDYALFNALHAIEKAVAIVIQDTGLEGICEVI